MTEHPGAGTGVESARSAKILIVDDVGFFRERVKEVLAGAGFTTIFEAESGKEAIAMVHGARVDLVVLDVAMPDADGISVLKVMRKLKSRAKVIIVTAAASPEVVRRALKAGADQVLVKPVEDGRLLAAVEHALG